LLPGYLPQRGSAATQDASTPPASRLKENSDGGNLAAFLFKRKEEKNTKPHKEQNQ
jgi:hypothetical protein